MKITPALLLLFVLSLCACDRPECQDTNPVFGANSPNTKVYKDELVKELQTVDQSKLTYWLKKYEEKNGVESLYFNMQGDGLCAILHLNVKDWKKLEDVRKRKGVGHRGAEFTDLKFDVITDSVSTKFMYVTYDRLID